MDVDTICAAVNAYRYRHILTGARGTIREERAERILLVVDGERHWIDRADFVALWRACKPEGSCADA